MNLNERDFIEVTPRGPFHREPLITFESYGQALVRGALLGVVLGVCVTIVGHLVAILLT